MIDRQYGKIVICCDCCDATFEGERDEEFQSVWAGAKREGWMTRQIAKTWMHACPACKL